MSTAAPRRLGVAILVMGATLLTPDLARATEPAEGGGSITATGHTASGSPFTATLTTSFTPSRIGSDEGFSFHATLDATITDTSAEGCDQPPDDHTGEDLTEYGFAAELPGNTIYESGSIRTEIVQGSGAVSQTTIYFGCNKVRLVNIVTFTAAAGGQLSTGCWQSDVVGASLFVGGSGGTLATLNVGQPAATCGVTECGDTVDNDDDGLSDSPADPGCTSLTDDSEHEAGHACDDGSDNDGDLLADFQLTGGDPGCSGPLDTDEDDRVTLHVEVDGRGTAAGCRSACSTQHQHGSSVTIAAVPDARQYFHRFEGDCTGTPLVGGEGRCTLTMDADKHVKAVFGTGSFTWSMPERFNGEDNGHGLARYFTPLNYSLFSPAPDDDPIHPDRWRVQLRGGPCPAGVTGQWAEGVEIVASGCAADLLLSEGTHTLSLLLNGAVVDTQQVIVKDWLIAAIGDSYGSGEGNPDVPRKHAHLPIGPKSRWENKQCHRSAYAAAAQVAMRVEAASTHSSATLLHLSCSGATIREGLIGGYNGAAPDDDKWHPKDPQTQELDRVAGKRQIDALLISIGGNDIGFSGLIKDCLIYRRCHDGGKKCIARSFWVPLRGLIHRLSPRTSRCKDSAVMSFAKTIPRLADKYRALAQAVAVLKVDPSHVIVAGYPDATHGSNGAICGRKGNARILGDAVGQALGAVLNPVLQAALRIDAKAAQARGYLTIDGDEADWAYDTVLLTLNAEIKKAAKKYGWTYVGTHVPASKRHGYCAKDTWMVSWTQAKRLQESTTHGLGPSPGAVHPNHAGHRAYRDAILPEIKKLGIPVG